WESTWGMWHADLFVALAAVLAMLYPAVRRIWLVGSSHESQALIRDSRRFGRKLFVYDIGPRTGRSQSAPLDGATKIEPKAVLSSNCSRINAAEGTATSFLEGRVVPVSGIVEIVGVEAILTKPSARRGFVQAIAAIAQEHPDVTLHMISEIDIEPFLEI